MNGLAYFDLDDVVAEVLGVGHPLTIICGEQYGGCLERTRQALAERAAALGRALPIDVLPGHGHAFSPTVRRRIVEVLGTLHNGSQAARVSPPGRPRTWP